MKCVCVSICITHQYFFIRRASSTFSFGLCPNAGGDEKEDAEHAREECKCKEGSVCGGRRALSTCCAAAVSLVAWFASAAEAASGWVTKFVGAFRMVVCVAAFFVAHFFLPVWVEREVHLRLERIHQRRRRIVEVEIVARKKERLLLKI